jgi:hypothetical protein
LLQLVFNAAIIGCDVERFTHSEQTYRKHDHVNTVQQLGHTKSKTGLPGLTVDADDA